MILQERAEVALDLLRGGLQADGADLKLVSIDPETAHVRLIVTSETCFECIVPGPVLYQVIEASLRDACPELVTIDLEDPRPADGISGK
jgi:Fe-S cluster biogenesis protein NfuA